MRFFTRRPKTTVPARPTRTTFTAGMCTYLADLAAGDAYAVDIFRGRAPMPADDISWARYPKDPTRLERLKHFGGPSELDLPQQRPGVTA